MIFKKTPLAGAFIIEPELVSDPRGFFARAFCADEFETYGMNPRLVQCNISYNKLKGTLRGMHFQLPPKAEVKLVRCTRGFVYDVIIDLRPDSITHLGWFGMELSADNHKMIYIPEGFAHGYVTLSDGAEVFYQVSEYYSPEHERGIRWDDPHFDIEWPVPPLIISEKDGNIPDYSVEA